MGYSDKEISREGKIYTRIDNIFKTLAYGTYEIEARKGGKEYRLKIGHIFTEVNWEGEGRNISKKPMTFTIARIIAAGLLFWALGGHPYGYYTLLRFIVCGVTAYGAWFAYQLDKKGWVWCLGIIAILFNPIFPVHMDRGTWAIVDIGVAIILLVSLFGLRRPEISDEKRKKLNEKMSLL